MPTRFFDGLLLGEEEGKDLIIIVSVRVAPVGGALGHGDHGHRAY